MIYFDTILQDYKLSDEHYAIILQNEKKQEKLTEEIKRQKYNPDALFKKTKNRIISNNHKNETLEKLGYTSLSSVY